MSTPERIQVTRWRCTHCGRSWSNRRTAREHADRCWYDPANRACKTCDHFVRGHFDHDTGAQSDEGCARGVRLPVIERFGQVRPSLAVHCDLHRVRDRYLHPDAVDAIERAATT